MLRSGVSFRLFRFPVRVQIWFFITLLFISVERLRPLFDQPFLSITTFFEAMIVATVAVLVHELGHAFFYRRYGQEPSIVLWGLGGLTFGQSKLGPKREILVSAAGPLIGILLMGLPAWALQEYVLGPVTFGSSDLVLLGHITVNDIKWFALFWSLVNLLPMIPLDGGHITEAVLELVKGEPQKQTARIVSVVTGVIFGTATFFFLGWSTIFLFLGYGLALYNFIAYRQEQQGSMVRFDIVPEHGDGDGGGGGGSVVSMDSARRKRDRRSAPDLAEAGYLALERRDYRGALKIVERLRAKRLSSDLSRQTGEIAALAWLGEHNPPKAAEEMGQLPRGADSSRALVAVLAIADKRVDDGLTMMVRSLTSDPPSPSRIIAVDLFAEYGMIHRLARELVDLDGGAGFEAAVALEGMLHQLNRTQDAATVSDVILLG